MHLRHRLPWDDLLFCLKSDPTEISLPIGECGKIHIINKATEIKVNHRKFISDDDVCTSSSCGTIKKLGVFSKNKKILPTLSPRRSGRKCNEKVERKFKYFEDKFCEALMEFAETEEKKYSEIIVSESELASCLAVTEGEDYGSTFYFNDRDKLVFSLFSAFKMKELLLLQEKGLVDIKEAFSRSYGGQAVGNGYNFLILYHLLPFYLIANTIIACGYESNPRLWGLLSPSNYFQKSLLHDCDFFTFIPALRSYLDESIFMKDLNKTNELLQKIFKYLYCYVFLKKRFCYYNLDNLKHDFAMRHYFRLPSNIDIS